MNEYFRKVANQIGEFIRTLSPGKKTAMAATTAAIIAAVAGLFIWAGKSTYATLMTNLSPEDSANVIRVLREKKIPFTLDSTGKNISVPPESIDILRLELAMTGLPQNSVVGYEVFDKQSLGTTSFVQKLNQKRALEGELTRTIDSIQGVRRSRVHLALPQKSTFVEDQKKSSASVVLDLDPGTQLNEKQVFGIGNLVARAVEGMEVNDVVIMDNHGKVLSKNNSDPLAAATATQMDYQKRLEGEFEKKIEAMLGRVVGEGHVIAKVAAELDFSQVSETQTQYEGDNSAIRTVDRRTDSMQGSRPGPGGLQGAASNQPGDPPAANQVKTETNKNNEVVSYEIPQTVRRVVKPTGQVRKISVAVVVDGKQVKTTDKDGKTLAKTEPWPAEKLKEFEDIVASAVAIDRKRGDSLEIRNMEFQHEDFEEAARLIAERERKAYIMNLMLYGVIGLTILLFFIVVVRPFIKWITENTIDSVDTFLPQTIEELEKIQKSSAIPTLEEAVPVLPDKVDPEKVEGEMMKEKIITMIDSNPHKAALILKDWLVIEGPKKGQAIATDAPAGGGGKKTG
jgi:flagellar M-ring protein FliF